MSTHGPDSEDTEDGLVARNRATPLRRVPGRRELGHDVTRRLLIFTGIVVLLATLVLAAAVT